MCRCRRQELLSRRPSTTNETLALPRSTKNFENDVPDSISHVVLSQKRGADPSVLRKVRQEVGRQLDRAPGGR